MIRVYARENATQRGNSSTAVAGTVASAVRFLAKVLMVDGDVARNLARSQKALETIKGQLASDKGLGWDFILSFLQGVPGINKPAVEQQLANLKASGDYARIIGKVKDEIEREHREALKELERVERERQKAEEAERKGISPWSWATLQRIGQH